MNKSLLIIVFLVIVTEVIFLNKAISTDGIFYIYTARQIQKNPFKPYDFVMNDNGYLRPASEIANNPPFFSYYLAGGEKILPRGITEEKKFHLLMLVWTILAVVGFWALSGFYIPLSSLRFVATIFWFFSPAFLVNSTNVMYDIPLVAFLLWAIYFYQLGIKRNSFSLRITGLLIGLLAGWIKFYGLLVIICFLFLEEKNQYRLLVGITGVLFVFLSEVFWRILANYSFFLAAGRVGGGRKISLEKFWAIVNYLGGGFLFPLAFWLLRQKYWQYLVGFLVFLGGGIFFTKVFTVIPGIQLTIFLVSFLGLLFWFINCKVSSKEESFLHFWAGIFLLFNFLVSSIFALRYLLPAIAALILLLARNLKEYPWPKYVFSVFSVILGILITVSDYQYAGVYPEIVGDVKKYCARDFPIYFCGHQGFQYYLEKEKAIAVLTENTDWEGVVVLTRFSDPQRIYPGLRQELILRKFYPAKLPIFTQNTFAAAGFHLNLFGVMPYAVAVRTPLEILDIRRVSP